MLKALERFVGVLEWKGLDVGSYGNRCGLLEKREPVRSGVVRYGAKHALAIEKLVRELRDWAHVNPAEHEGAALVEMRERGGYDFTGGREDDASVESDRGLVDRAARPDRTKLLSEGLMLLAVAGADVDLGSARSRDLDRDMTGGAESVEPEAGARPIVDARLRKTAVADDAGAKEGRRLQVRKALREWIGEARRRHQVFRKSSLNGPTGEIRGVAEVLALAGTKEAAAAGAVKPGNADARADMAIGHRRAERFDRTDDLVARDDRGAPYFEITFDDVKIGSTDTAGPHFDENLVGGWFGNGDIAETQGMRLDWSGLLEKNGTHFV